MNSRFVILHHTRHDGEHWDLMLEHGGVLLTWQVAPESLEAAASPVDATRIADHRSAYLGYEGPISGGRGSVRRVDEGKVRIETLEEDRCIFQLQGRYTVGSFSLVRTEGHHWQLSRR